MEFILLEKQKAIQSTAMAFSYTIVNQILLFLIFVPTVYEEGNERSLSYFFTTLSLLTSVTLSAIIFVILALTCWFDAHTANVRIQVYCTDLCVCMCICVCACVRVCVCVCVHACVSVGLSVGVPFFLPFLSLRQ